MINVENLNRIYEGKSKSVFAHPSDDTLCVLQFKNDATAFNGEKKASLEGKGVICAKISNYIFDYLAKNGIKTHIKEVINDTHIVVDKVDVIMVEIIIRNIAAGSFAKKFGVKEGTALLNTTTEFSLKSDELGDPLISNSHITALGIATQAELDFIQNTTLRVNELLQALCKKAGLVLVDFKLEFGKNAKGNIVLCDEISPDGCRLWDIETGKKMDKDRFRQDLGGFIDSYQEVWERLINA